MHANPLLCTDFNNEVRWLEDERLDQVFEQRCDELPADHLAIVAENVALTFRELDNQANQVARHLLGRGLKPGDRVGLLFDKSVHAYTTLLAVVKLGAAYVPLDAGFPADRIGFILEDAGISAVVSVSRFRDKLAEFDVPRIFVDLDQPMIGARSEARLRLDEKPASSDRLFYIIYTSGTTGKPKGVAIEHAGICNFVKVAKEVYGVREDDRCYQGMTLAFDFHVEDLWVPLISGATLIAGKSSGTLFGGDLHAFLREQRVTVLPCVPTLWATLEADLPDVRIVLLSGEAVPHNLVVRWHRPGRTILNAYGPTECSVSSTLRKLEPESPVTIGRPLPTYTVVILDEHKDAVVEHGAIGEIGIAGIGLALGYLNREELTKQKFISDFLDLPNNPSKRIYRTGDLGRIREDGELEFHGRIDTQIKIRGYRVELEEIEAVLLELPHISQAVANPYEAEPGATELVAYFTRKQGAPYVSLSDVLETLRRRLPGYMVPAYLEELPLIPMTSNNKADRKNLPAPTGPRLSVSSSKYVAPRTATEKALSDALIEVMRIERASVEDNFFSDLGGHSLLMARFSADIRRRLNISAVSMQDIYLNPTIEKLARHIDFLPEEESEEGEQGALPFHIPSDLDYYRCGALQLAWYVGWMAIGVWVFVASIRWTYAAMPDYGTVFLRVEMLAAALLVLTTIVPLAVKWLVIGKWKPEVIPIWSLRYFRFWALRGFVRSAPIARFGAPYYNLYLRLLGAKIGANTVIQAKSMPVCTDLISIGANTVISKDAILQGYKAQSNYIHTGAVTIGSNAFVGEAGILDIDTTMEDDTQLGHASSLHSGQRIPKGKHYHGCPAQETTADYCVIEPKTCSTFRRWAYPTSFILTGFVLAPIPVIILYALFPHIYELIVGQFPYDAPANALLALGGETLLATLTVFFIGVPLALLSISLIARLLNRLLETDKTYVLYGWHHFVHQWISGMTNSVFYNRLFGDSSAIVHYLGWIGYRLNTIIQTGSNFGMDQRHDNPFLCDIGTGTMVSGGLKMMNKTMSHEAFKVSTVKVGEHNYLGNYVRIPADSKMGANVLLGTKALVPIDGPIRENVGLLGSPAFEIPRATSRDLELAQMDDATRERQLHAKNRYNLVTGALFLLTNWFQLFVGTCAGLLALVYYPVYGIAGVYAYAAFSLFFGIFWLWFAERSVLRFGRLTPKVVSLLDEYFWFHERHWKLTGLWLIEPFFNGTPFRTIISRLQGVKIGKKCFDDGSNFDEYTLIEVGDYVNVNAECVVQPHSLEEGVFKSDYVKIGTGCTLGVASNVHYGVTMGDYVVLGTDSFLMKGEIVDSNTTWRGNPAKAVGGTAFKNVGPDAAETRAPACAA